jgi:acyl carrier protein
MHLPIYGMDLMETTTEQKIHNIFCNVFKNVAEVTKLQMNVSSEWDSLSAIELIMSIETEFDIVLNNEDMERIISYNSVKCLLEEKGFK